MKLDLPVRLSPATPIATASRISDVTASSRVRAAKPVVLVVLCVLDLTCFAETVALLATTLLADVGGEGGSVPVREG